MLPNICACIYIWVNINNNNNNKKKKKRCPDLTSSINHLLSCVFIGGFVCDTVSSRHQKIR